MKHIALLPNPLKDPDFLISRKISEFLMGLGAHVYTNEAYCSNAPDGVMLLPLDRLFEISECIVTLGGDGTLLHMAQQASLADKPILGINYGKIGYMAELEHTEIDLLRHLIDDEFTVEERFMLDVSVVRNEAEVFRSIALNDAVIACGSIARLIDMDVMANGQRVATYTGDGLIVSTPTGSTGYSLSAGGPILEPTTSAQILTPICPHILGTRPIVFAADSQLEISPIHLVEKDANLTIDGHQTLSLCDNDIIRIQKSQHVTKLIKIKNINFYRIINHKLVNGDTVL